MHALRLIYFLELLCSVSIFSSCGKLPIAETLVLENPVIVLGDVWPGETRTVEIIIRNTQASTDLQVTDVDTSCQCVSVVELPLSIGPESVGRIPVRVAFGRNEGDYGFKVKFKVENQDGMFAIVDSEIRGQVVKIANLSRGSIDFGHYDENSGVQTQRLTIRRGLLGSELDSVTISGVGAIPGMSVAISDGLKGAEVAHLDFLLDPLLGGAPFARKLKLSFVDKERRIRGSQDLWVAGQPLGKVNVIPNNIYIQRHKSKNSVDFEFEVNASNADEVLIENFKWLTKIGGREEINPIVFIEGNVASVKGTLKTDANYGEIVFDAILDGSRSEVEIPVIIGSLSDVQE